MPTTYLTEQDFQDYGRELIDVTQRAAAQAMMPAIAALEQQNAALTVFFGLDRTPSRKTSPPAHIRPGDDENCRKFHSRQIKIALTDTSLSSGGH